MEHPPKQRQDAEPKSLLRPVHCSIVRAMTHIWIGIGCDRGCDPALVAQTVGAALTLIGRTPAQVGGMATIDVKTDEAAITALAQTWQVPLRFFPAARLEQETPRLANPSKAVFAHMGCHGVAEAAALAQAGPNATLLLPKFKGPGVTIAIAGAA